jgi:hypothetical protein
MFRRRRFLVYAAAFLALFLVSTGPPALAAQWDHSAAYDGIAYFVFSSQHAIERYDMRSQTWLPPIPLTGEVTAFTVDSDAIYACYSSDTVRIEHDGSGETLLLSTSGRGSELVVDGDYLFIITDPKEYLSVNKHTGDVIDSQYLFYNMQGISIGPSLNRLFGASLGLYPPNVIYTEYGADGTFTEQQSSIDRPDNPGGLQTWMWPDETKMVQSGGAIYRTSDLRFARGLGARFDDISFYGVLPVVLRDRTLYAYTDVLAESGRYELDAPPLNIYVEGDVIYAFYEGTTQPVDVVAVPIDMLKPPDPGPPLDPTGLAYVPDQIELGNDGTVYLLSSVHRSIFRWSLETRSYLESIPLAESPLYMTYSSETNRLYLAYSGGRMTQVRLDESTAEEPYSTSPQTACGLTAAGEFVFICDPSGGAVSHFTFHPDGNLIGQDTRQPGSDEFVWDPFNRTMYTRAEYGADVGLWMEEIDQAGQFVARSYKRVTFDSKFANPIRLAPDGSVLLVAPARVYDPDSLVQVAELSKPFDDAAWLDGTLYTLRDDGQFSEVQGWLPDYTPGEAFLVPGAASRLYALEGGEFLIVTSVNGIPTFIVRPPGVWDSDGDGLSDTEEISVRGSDPLEIDTDGDGLADGLEVNQLQSSPTSPTDVWDLRGVASRRFGRTQQTLNVVAMLLLSEDRNYVLMMEGEDVPERGAWFNDRGKILLYPQNILEQVQDLEQTLSEDLGEPVQVSLLQMRSNVSINARSGQLSLSASNQGRATLLDSHGEERLSISVKLAGTLGTPASVAATMRSPTDAEEAREGASVAPAAASASTPGVPVSMWSLTGTVTARFGRGSATGEATGLLTLYDDRTYLLAAEGDDVPETGVWFQDRNNLILFQQNILEQLLPFEAGLTEELGEETELSLVQLRESAGFKKGALSLSQNTRFNAYFPGLDLQLPLSISAKLTGSQVP